ncbi:MAG: cbb3-type cytochrome oxidase assembly protein CcoS [Flavobacteriales bacterium]|nr:cbb3-type cytochrome oxidase assembly protein CcoS [Flavobacteriales bacterium]
MSIIFMLTGVSLLLAIGFLGAFLWAIRNGQYEDDYTPSVRMLFEDSKKEKKSNENKNQKQ